MEKKSMPCMKHKSHSSGAFAVRSCLLSGIWLMLYMTGCGAGNTQPSSSPATTQLNGPQSYLAPVVAGTTNAGSILFGPETYSIDDSGDHAFSQTTVLLQVPQQEGPQVINSGMATSTSSRGLLSLQTSANYVFNSLSNTWVATAPPATAKSGFVVELAGQAGGFIQLAGEPVAPLVAAVQCPNIATAQTYQFVTIPGGLVSSAAGPQQFAWNPTTDTAFGSVDISSTGSMVSFTNFNQSTFPSPSTGKAGTPPLQPQPSSTTVMGACAPTFFGNTISLPNPLIITDPGLPGQGQNAPPTATLAIGPTGLLVEDNGVNSLGIYQTALGAGTGAVGLPKPTSALDTGAVIGKQYLGFVYGSGVYSNAASPAKGWSSHLVSFGFPTTPSDCASTAPSTSTMIYGGDFRNDDPTTGTNGLGNCDLAIDLGPQDSANNGSYPMAKVWMGANYAANTTGKTYSFPAVAIAGQLSDGKSAIFLIGFDSTQPWGIYLLQSK
jgi:hypothetical protein